MKNKFIGAALFFCVVFFTPALISAQQSTPPPIFFDAFLFDGGGQPAENFNLFFQWEVTGGSVDLVGGNIPGATDQVNGRFVELGGSTGNPGAFATRLAFPFAAGMTYSLRFDYKSSDGNSNSAQVTIGSKVYTVTTSSTELQSFNRRFTFDTLTTAPLVFQNLESDTDNSGIGIDNVVLSVEPVVQPPLFFDAFLFDNGGQPAENFNLFFLWDVTGGSVDLVGGNVPGAADQINGRFVELGGSTNNPGTFATRTAFPFAPGATYNLRFDYKSSDGGDNSAQVSIGSQVYTVQTNSTELQTFSQNFSFDTLTTANLIFQNLESDTDNSGIGIDNVVLSQVLSPTAAGVTVGGRVMTASGRPIAKARVTMIDGAGNTAVAVSSASGGYEFTNVAVNAFYVFNVSAKGHVFVRQSQAVSVSDNTDNVDFISSTGRVSGAKQSLQTIIDFK